MRLGIPFETYIIIFEIGVAASVVAMQCDRRERSSLYAKALYEQMPHKLAWMTLFVLGSLAWPALLVLPFFQFRVTTALFWIVVGALPAAILVGVAGLQLREPEAIILIHRICHALAFGAACFLWWQGITAHA